MEETAANMSEDARRWKNFMIGYKKHRYISPFGIVSTNEGGSINPNRYVINCLKGLMMPGVRETSVNSLVFAIISATFFSKKKGKFFGRTYQSDPIPLTESRGSGGSSRSYETDGSQKHYFYAHSQIDDNSDTWLVLELELKEINVQNNTVVSQHMAGWTSIEQAAGPKTDKTYTFSKGTARNAIALRETEVRGSSVGTISFEILRADNLLNAYHLFPSAVLVGQEEILPGVEGDHLPSTNKSEINLIDTRDLYIERAEAEVSSDILVAVKEDCRRFRAEKYGKVADVYVQEVRLYAYYHNSWTAVNREGFSNYTVLRRINDERYEFNGIFTVGGIFPHEMAYLVVQLEATVKIPLENSIEESMRVVLGWKPYHLNPTRPDPIPIEELDLVIGNGYTLNFDKLFNLPGRKNDTRIKLRLGLNMTNTMSRSLAPSTLGLPQRPTSDADNLIVNRLKDRLRETSMETQKLKKANEQLEVLLRNNAEKERQSNYSPPPVQSMQTSFMQQPVPVTQQGMSPDFERQYLQKMDKLLETITEMQRKQVAMPQQQPVYLPSQNQNVYQPAPPSQDAFARLKQEREMAQNRPMHLDYDRQANQIRNRMVSDFQNARQSDSMSRVDRAGYIEAGVKGLIDPLGFSDPALTNLNIKAEFDDPKKISTITLQFLGLRFFAPGASNPGGLRIPERLFFTFDFFTYPTFRTKSLTYLNAATEELKLAPATFIDKQLVLANEDFVRGSGAVKEPLYYFEIDPLKEGTTEIYNQLVEYLATKELVVDLWDGDSLMHFGRSRMRLHGLLRQSKDAEACSPTLEVWDETTRSLKATLQMSLKNQAVMMDSRSAACPPEITHFHFNRNARAGKHKVKSFKPLDIKKELSSGFEASRAISDVDLQDEEYRKRLRIDRFKLMRSQLPAGPVTEHKGAADFQAFSQSLREVEAIRERKKPEVIANALAKGFSETHTISAIFGHPKFVTYKFENVARVLADFKIRVEYGKNCLPNEFVLVRNPREWEALAYSLKLERPSQYDMLESFDTFSLGPGESVTLIFKFISTDEQTLKLEKSQDKIASISIAEPSGQVLCGLAFDFRVRHPIIDRSLTFYEMENRITTLDLPQFYNVVGSSYPRPAVDFSNPSVVLEWVDSNTAKLKFKVPAAPMISTFYMFVYEDELRVKLLGLYRLVVYAQAGIDISCSMGQVLPLKLTLESSIRRMAKIYTDSPKLIAFDEQFQQQFELYPGSYNYATYKLRSFRPGTFKARVNCVDNFSKELVQGWTIQIHTNAVAPDQTIPVQLQQYKSELLSPLPFDNRLDMPVTYEIESADPEVIQVVDRSMTVEAHARNFVKLRAVGQTKLGPQEVFVYITSKEGAAGECWRLLLTVNP